MSTGSEVIRIYQAPGTLKINEYVAVHAIAHRTCAFEPKLVRDATKEAPIQNSSKTNHGYSPKWMWCKTSNNRNGAITNNAACPWDGKPFCEPRMRIFLTVPLHRPSFDLCSLPSSAQESPCAIVNQTNHQPLQKVLRPYYVLMILGMVFARVDFMTRVWIPIYSYSIVNTPKFVSLLSLTRLRRCLPLSLYIYTYI